MLPTDAECLATTVVQNLIVEIRNRFSYPYDGRPRSWLLLERAQKKRKRSVGMLKVCLLLPYLSGPSVENIPYLKPSRPSRFGQGDFGKGQRPH